MLFSVKYNVKLKIESVIRHEETYTGFYDGTTSSTWRMYRFC